MPRKRETYQWEDPEIEDWEFAEFAESEAATRNEADRQIFIGGFGPGIGLGFGFGFGCFPRRICFPRRFCFPRQFFGCFPRRTCFPRPCFPI